MQKLLIIIWALKKYLTSYLIVNEHFEMNMENDEKFIDDGSVQCGEVIGFRDAYEK